MNFGSVKTVHVCEAIINNCEFFCLYLEFLPYSTN